MLTAAKLCDAFNTQIAQQEAGLGIARAKRLERHKLLGKRKRYIGKIKLHIDVQLHARGGAFGVCRHVCVQTPAKRIDTRATDRKPRRQLVAAEFHKQLGAARERLHKIDALHASPRSLTLIKATGLALAYPVKGNKDRGSAVALGHA